MADRRIQWFVFPKPCRDQESEVEDIRFHCAQNNVDRSTAWLKQHSGPTGTNPGWHRTGLHTHASNSLASQCREVLNLQPLVVFRMDVILCVFPQHKLNETRRKGGLVFFSSSGCNDVAAPSCLPIIIVWSALTTAFGQWSAWTFWEKPQHSTRDKCVGQEAPPPWIWQECCVSDGIHCVRWWCHTVALKYQYYQWGEPHGDLCSLSSLVFSAYLFSNEPMKI